MHKKFNFETVEDFDNHISLSIPNYQGLCDIFHALSLEFMPPTGNCVDIGCSTGSFLNRLSPSIEGNYVGVDLVDMSSEKNFDFQKADVCDFINTLKTVDLMICMFTLQFLGKHKRAFVVEKMSHLIESGATLLIAEKVYSNSSKLHSVFTKEHFNQKRKVFSDTEILDKDYSLMGKMFCVTYDEMMRDLDILGRHEQVWQSYNFHGWIVEKK